jgi:hypothetical protein
MSVRGRDAARDGGGAIAGSRKLRKPHDSRHYSSKEKHGEEEKKMASSRICLPRRLKRPTKSPSNGSARAKLRLEIRVKRKEIGSALAYMGLGHLNLDRNPGKIDFDSVKIEFVTGSVTT